MRITPMMSINRLAKLNAGDLFISWYDEKPFFGLAVQFPAEEGASRDRQMFMVSIGGNRPENAEGAVIISDPGLTTVSFGGNFDLRLPLIGDRWTDSVPESYGLWIAVNDTSAYFRCEYGRRIVPGSPLCFVDIATGLVVMSPPQYKQFGLPAGTLAYALDWDIFTSEPEPRPLVRYSMSEKS